MTIERSILVWAAEKAGLDPSEVDSVKFATHSGVGCETCGDYWVEHEIFLFSGGRTVGLVTVGDFAEILTGAQSVLERP